MPAHNSCQYGNYLIVIVTIKIKKNLIFDKSMVQPIQGSKVLTETFVNLNPVID